MTTSTRPITREQFEAVRPLLEQHRRQTRPRLNDLYDVLCAILYRESANIAWRALPADFPKWRTVHEYHRMWTMPPVEGGPTMLEQVRAILKIS
jgi:transposase